jgi:hypothetical protein
MKELEKNELVKVDGGKVAYWWPDTDNGIVYFFSALYNGAVSVRNVLGD